MLDFIVVPLVVGMITLGVYKFFELLVCRRERLNIIEKLDPGALIDYLKNVRLGLPLDALTTGGRTSAFSSGALRLGCLLVGLGLGLLVGYWIVACDPDIGYAQSVVYGGSVLSLGGLGLIVAFIVERLVSRKDRA